MGTLLIKGSITSEIQSHPVSVSSYHPNKDLEGEYGFIITRRVGERNTIIVHTPAIYVTRNEALSMGFEVIYAVREGLGGKFN